MEDLDLLNVGFYCVGNKKCDQSNSLLLKILCIHMILVLSHLFHCRRDWDNILCQSDPADKLINPILNSRTDKDEGCRKLETNIRLFEETANIPLMDVRMLDNGSGVHATTLKNNAW